MAGVRDTAVLGLLACTFLASACFESGDSDDPNGNGAPRCPDRVVDTLGDDYALDCEAPAAPLAERRMPSCTGEETLFFRLHPSERLLRVCRFAGDLEGFGSVSDDDCRPIACTTSADCPSPYTCRAGLCQIPSRPVTGEDALVLCLSEIAWPGPCSSIAIDPALPALLTALEPCLEDDEAPCQVPSICKQP
jgi:hypothetical protein